MFQKSAEDLMVLISDHTVITECQINKELSQIFDILTIEFVLFEVEEILQNHLVDDWPHVSELLLQLCLVKG